MSDHAPLAALADLLLGAAHADGSGATVEVDAVRALLTELAGEGGLPEPVAARIAAFELGALDVEGAAKTLTGSGLVTARQVLELCCKVRDADEEIDLAEDDYMRKVGAALGLAASDFADLTVEVEIEELKKAFAGSLPPPPPRGSGA